MKVIIEDGCITLDRDFKGPLSSARTLLDDQTIQDLIIIEGGQKLSPKDEKFLQSLLQPTPSKSTFIRSYRWIDMSRFRQILDFPID